MPKVSPADTAVIIRSYPGTRKSSGGELPIHAELCTVGLKFRRDPVYIGLLQRGVSVYYPEGVQVSVNRDKEPVYSTALCAHDPDILEKFPPAYFKQYHTANGKNPRTDVTRSIRVQLCKYFDHTGLLNYSCDATDTHKLTATINPTKLPELKALVTRIVAEETAQRSETSRGKTGPVLADCLRKPRIRKIEILQEVVYCQGEHCYSSCCLVGCGASTIRTTSMTNTMTTTTYLTYTTLQF